MVDLWPVSALCILLFLFPIMVAALVEVTTPLVCASRLIVDRHCEGRLEDRFEVVKMLAILKILRNLPALLAYTRLLFHESLELCFAFNLCSLASRIF